MINKLDWSHDNILAYEAVGKLTKKEHILVYDEMINSIRKYGRLRLLIRIPAIAFPELSALGLRLQFAKEHMNQIERLAVVSNLHLLKLISRIADAVTKINVRYFSMKDESRARTWLESGNEHILKNRFPVVMVTIVAAIIIMLIIKKIIAAQKQETKSNNDQ